MNRRRFLRFAPVGVTVVPGCLGTFNSESTPTTPTSTPPIESQVTVPDCPGKPDPLTRENVVEFALRFEHAYVTREVLDEHARVTYVTFSAGENVHPDEWTEPTVAETADGFVVRFGVRVRHGRRRFDSTHVKHVDDPPYTANYFVSGERMLRAESGRDHPVDPRAEGEAVQCPPE